ncbi:MAG: DUF2493 domain-containing protein [Paracoccaceae bacterium]|nr:DUF2493 domain-containing protein [Paracoccaceae bacterium]
MRVIVCGGRDFSDRVSLGVALNAQHAFVPFRLLLHGGARGADLLAAEWADSRNIPSLEYRADWQRYGNGAGPIRNRRMLDEGRPGLVIAFPGGLGTANMCEIAEKAGINVIKPVIRDREQLVQITADHFTAAVVLKGGIVIDAAPIIKYMVGWDRRAVWDQIKKKKWRWAVPGRPESRN